MPMFYRVLKFLAVFTVLVSQNVHAELFKLSVSGKVLADAVTKVGAGGNDWACTYDSNTNLIWEVKTNDDGMRGLKWNYSWYNGSQGVKDGGTCASDGRCDTKKYVDDMNSIQLCGRQNWRLPEKTELEGLLLCPQGFMGFVFSYQCYNNYRVVGRSQNDGLDINIVSPEYFPNTGYADPSFLSNLNDGKDHRDPSQLNSQPQLPGSSGANDLSAAYWSATLYEDVPDSAWYVDFRTGAKIFDGLSGSRRVRLVAEAEAGFNPVKPTDSSIPDDSNNSQSGDGFVEGYVQDECNGKPLSGIKVNAGNEQLETDAQGQYKIKLPFGSYKVEVKADSGYVGEAQNVSLALEVRPFAFADFLLQPTRGCGSVAHDTLYKAIVIAATGPALADGTNNAIWSATQKMTNQAYLTLRAQGFGANQIRFLSAQPQAQDVDNDQQDDISASLTPENFQAALEWAASDNTQSVLVYLIGQTNVDKGVGNLVFSPSYQLNASSLKTQLDALQQKLSRKLVVVLDASYAGSFLKPLAATNRVVITSTADDRNAWFGSEGSHSFSNYFWKTLGMHGGRVLSAFEEARKAMSAALVQITSDTSKTQTAWLDASGDGIYSFGADYEQLGGYCLGECKSGTEAIATITGIGSLSELGGKLKHKLSMHADKPLSKAWVTMQRPDYHTPAAGIPLTGNLRIELSCNGQDCQMDYGNFNVNGNYVVTYFAEDAQGNQTGPRAVTLNQKGLDEQANAQKLGAVAVYEADTGILSIKDVVVGTQHFSAELTDQGGYNFILQPYYYALDEVVVPQPATYDGVKVEVPDVFAFGEHYRVVLGFDGSVFKVTDAVKR